jgi:DNA repair ATPase RecN
MTNKYEEKIKKNVSKMALHIVKLGEQLTAARTRIFELEKLNNNLSGELCTVRKHNARHLNEIQRIAVEKDRYARIIDLMPEARQAELADLLAGMEPDECPTDH